MYDSVCILMLVNMSLFIKMPFHTFSVDCEAVRFMKQAAFWRTEECDL